MTIVDMILALMTIVWCGTSAIDIRGKGASFPYEVYKVWQPAFTTYRKGHASIEMQYDAIGSSKGQAAIFQNIDIEYAGSDTVLSELDKSNHPDLVEFPTMAGAIVMGYNLPNFGSNKLNLSLQQLVGIYNGTYTSWSDATFTTNNPNGIFPNSPIIVIARADKSGSTELFTSALSAVDQNWNSTYGTFSRGINDSGSPYHWNPNAITYYGVQTRGVSGLLLSFRNSLGYLSVADVQDGIVETALLQNGVGEYMSPTSQAVQNAMDYFAAKNPSAQTFSLANSGGSGSYPIAGFTHFIIYKTSMTNCDSAKELIRYIDWFMTQTTPRHDCEVLGFAPLSADMVNRVHKNTLEQVTCKGRNMWQEVMVDMEREEAVAGDSWQTEVAIAVPITTIVLGILGGYILFQRCKYWRLLNKDDWLVPIEDIVFYYDSHHHSAHHSSLFARSARSLQSAQSEMDKREVEAMIDKVLQWPGKWKGHDIGVRLLEIPQMQILTKDMKQEMLRIRDKVHHLNIVKFYGLTVIDNEKYLIGEYCRKGSLADVLQDNKITMTADFKMALALDICQGMNYLHHHHVTHGNLKARVCFVDCKWTVKVGDWEFLKVLTLNNENDAMAIADMHADDSQSQCSWEFWVAPEVLRANYKCRITHECDVYSFAIVLQEIYSQEEPYTEHLGTTSNADIIHAIYSSNLRPKIQLDIPVAIRQIMEIAWTDNPVSRPSFDQILKLMKRNSPVRKSVMDSVIQSMEDYTQHLEECVEEKTIELESTKKNLESMMSSIIPGTIANAIANGDSIDHDEEKLIGIICVEITKENDFNNLTSKEKVEKLTSMCTYLDLLVSKYSAFRYSSHGTSFMIVVGMGEVNNNNEYCVALKTAHMCLDILTHEHIEDSSCSSDDVWMMQLSIGAHVGITTTGIIETDTPQFVLFSDLPEVVRCLARSSDASKIHTSMDLRKKILTTNNFSTERSGLLIVRGVEYETYWLTGRNRKFSNNLLNKTLIIPDPQLQEEKEKEEPNMLSPSPNNLLVPMSEKISPSVSPMPNEIYKKPALANEAKSPKLEKKAITFANETRSKENGALKMVNGKTKTSYQRRRTKQRSDPLPEVMEVTIDVEDDFAEV
ncbi:atrial natriuretic peptide receptor 2-like [Saccostrea cucullata]|uniref:atrial natriuretic peptide receptor 2-like n=1 Tax=Saccostrea cuccullata TaxID=36930 RepID=UPI002ECFE605